MGKRNSFNPLSGLLSFILLVFIIVSAFVFGLKKFCFDYDGTYATNRITYSDEFGFTLLVTYHTKYQRPEAKGFACVHIPPDELLSNRALWARKDGSDVSDSEEQYKIYQSLLLPLTMKPDTVPKKGTYFIVEYEDSGYVKKATDL